MVGVIQGVVGVKRGVTGVKPAGALHRLAGHMRCGDDPLLQGDFQREWATSKGGGRLAKGVGGVFRAWATCEGGG